jgi:opacity protein-like surface antigen
MRTGKAVLVLAAMVVSPAHADMAKGRYGRADIGYSLAGDVDFEAAAVIGGEAEIEDAAMGSIGAAYAFGNGLRAEAELSFRSHDLQPRPAIDQGGSVEALALIFNLYYDFSAGAILHPYLGGGLGTAQVEVEAANTFPLNPALIDDEATVFAYQLMAGVAIQLGSNLGLDLGYRYFSVPSLEGHGAAPPVISFPFDADLTQQALTLGLRWGF